MNCSVTHLHMRRALYRVFVQPALTDLAFQRSEPLLFCPRIAQWAPQRQQIRTKTTKKQKLARDGGNDGGVAIGAEAQTSGKKSYKERVAERPAPPLGRGPRFTRPPNIKSAVGPPDRPPYDEEITSMHINVVDRDGVYHANLYKPDVLRNLDRANEHLVQVAFQKPPRSVEEGEESSVAMQEIDEDDPFSMIGPSALSDGHNTLDTLADPTRYTLPTCRVYSKALLRERATHREERLKERAKIAKSSKVVEISWVIAKGDMQIKCNQVKGFLQEGRKVDVVMLPPERRRGWKKGITQGEMEEVVEFIKESVEEVDGVVEDNYKINTISTCIATTLQPTPTTTNNARSQTTHSPDPPAMTRLLGSRFFSTSIRRCTTKTTTPKTSASPFKLPTIKPYDTARATQISRIIEEARLEKEESLKPPPAPAPAPKTPWRSSIGQSLLITVSFLLLGHVFWSDFYEFTEPYGASMLPTLYLSGEWIIINKRYRFGNGIQVGDIITARAPTDPKGRILKRVIGMSGDFVMSGEVGVECDAWDVGDISYAGGGGRMIQIPMGHCWLGGDNLEYSRDSRHYGCVPLGLVTGKVVGRFWPLNKIGGIGNGLVESSL
ncbi:hypothetical protein EJ08DRAFT_695437 [Tothia fuscella]|uniref:Mitochondrial inner membrane protease subunit n=1 Tax=Tothia fuscella TaxID=1048955 RepID=A0A9P4NU79_9PEZI|nr:hypothetical protein EJ08DRAFT_695437 [Tothia fuscella]